MTPNTAEAECNKDELELCQFLNANFFERVLRHSEQELDAELRIKSVQLSPATRICDKFASAVLRAEVQFEQGGVKTIKKMLVKSLPPLEDDSFRRDLLMGSHIFETEIGMYTEVLPRFERILRSIGDTTVLKPNCLYHSLNPRKLIIYEDLAPQGYRPIGAGPISMVEAKCALMKLAKWHAISHKLLSEDPHCFDKYCHSFVSLPNIMEMDFMTTAIDNFIEMLDSLPDLRQYVDCFNVLKKDLYKSFIDCFSGQIDRANSHACFVLCHGDYNYENLLVKKHPRTGELIDVVPTCFHFSYVGNAANDVLYSMFMLLDDNLRRYHYELLYFYFTHFTTTLKMIGYEGPKPKIMELKNEIAKLKSFELFLMVSCLPMRHALSAGIFDPEQLVLSEEYRKSLYHNETYIKEIKELLPIYLEKGYLNS